MAVIRVDIDCHPEPVAALPDLDRVDGPVIVMIHGYKYQPGHPVHCPHLNLLSEGSTGADGWPGRLGFSAGGSGLAIALGWPARGALWQAQSRARTAGRALATLLGATRRPVHVIAHSLGLEVALEALHHVPAGRIGRILSLTGACYAGRVAAALDTPAGREAEFFNITSRENDAFDFLFERLVAPPCAGDRAIGLGLTGTNVLTLQLDCPRTLKHLARLGIHIAPARRRICHWSSYSRPGVMEFYADLLRRPEHLSMAALRAGLPPAPAPRWSGLLAPMRLPLPSAQKAS